ncbi:unnamed protein product [Timema podura]|uniref:Uncharacterized protein n=1 Tax=Timema podura TaxID=61482 RepID=A0ABN7NI71_TIMPD|nr:unnamed protein product [Timema podura]
MEELRLLSSSWTGDEDELVMLREVAERKRNKYYQLSDLPLFLHAVSEEEDQVTAIIQEALASYNTNQAGPQKYLTTYHKYLHILNGEAEKEMHNFMAMEPFPTLKDFSRRINKYEEMKVEIGFLRNIIPLNLVSLDCKRNQFNAVPNGG